MITSFRFTVAENAADVNDRLHEVKEGIDCVILVRNAPLVSVKTRRLIERIGVWKIELEVGCTCARGMNR